MSGDTAKIDRLRAELESAFRNRGDLYRLFYKELCRALGPAQAETILTAAIEERGREVARIAFSDFDAKNATAIGEAFLKVSPDDGRLYPADIERLNNGIAFRVKRCPLKDAWTEAGLEDDEITTLCRIAGAFDRGLFEETGVTFQNRTWRAGDGPGCCHICLTNADHT